MPRTPAPLTVEKVSSWNHETQSWVDPHWLVKDGDELIATVYRSEADARAFVALPALIDLLREAATDEYGDTERYLGREWLTKARAALAQADGPKEQP